MHVSQCSGILACVQNRSSWEILICLFHSLHPLASHTSVCRHWIKVTCVHDIPFPPPIRTLSACCGWLAGSVLQGVGSWGLRQPRRPAAGEWVSGWSACSWGPLSSQGFAWFMWEMLFGPGLKAAGGVEGRMTIIMRLLWCCWHCEGMLVYRSVHCVAHRAAS